MYGISNNTKCQTSGVLQRSKVEVEPWKTFEVKYYLKIARYREKKSIEVSIDKNYFEIWISIVKVKHAMFQHKKIYIVNKTR